MRPALVALVCAVLLPSGAQAQPALCDALRANAAELAWDLTFVADPGVRIEGAALPKPFVDDTGRVHLFYETAPGPPTRQMYTVSADGLTFDAGRAEQPGDLRYHPYRVRMANGVWRRFQWDPQALEMRTDSSGDGVTFSRDPGVRYTLQADDRGWMGIHDEFVDGLGRVVMIYLADRDGLNNARRAVSADHGWTFTFDRGNVFGDAADIARAGGSSAYVDQKSTHLDGAVRRMFAMKQGCAIYSFLTTDGDAFVLEPGWRVSVKSWTDVVVRSLHDPVVVRLADGRFRMYVAAALTVPPGSPGRFVILTATTPSAR